MTIIVAGGTGFIGNALVERLLQERHNVVLLTRNPSKVEQSRPNLRVEEWDAKTIGPWGEDMNRADAIINLTGEIIAGKRWTKRQKEVILRSRVDATRALVQAIEQASKKPSLLISASAAGFYGNVPSGDVPESFPRGTDFLAAVCGHWEEEALAAAKSGVRVLTPRLGVVLAHDGGALARMLLPFKFFIGGPLGNGKQWFPWIHRDDVVDGILFLLQSSTISGAVNFVAPEPLTMKEFSRRIGEILHRPSWAPVPSLALRILLGEMADMLLTGQRVIPKKLIDDGYVFRYPSLASALREIVSSHWH
jgi:uncharacterized protein (TIGR01777 family)